MRFSMNWRKAAGEAGLNSSQMIVLIVGDAGLEEPAAITVRESNTKVTFFKC